MKLIKISPKFQITIPRSYRDLCCSGWFSFTVEDKVITLRPIEIKESRTDKEILGELFREFGIEGGEGAQ
jgi:hypothetical protein